ncbi:MAG: chromosome partitioning protein ParA [Beggiatoa sp. IS2]|nr:MAG: chromosome partitioning protein ParA [Beggiatoa sp. IS2]
MSPPVFNPDFCRNEREVESKLLVSYLLPILGYPPHTWHQEVRNNRFRLDFVVSASQDPGALSIVLEAKHPDENLNDHFGQLHDYMQELQIKYGLLTNGREIRIYEAKDNAIQLVFQCFGYGIEKKVAEIKLLIGREILIERSTTQSVQPIQAIEETNKSSIMKIIAVYHNKGGVGKTTTVVNLAAALSKEGRRVLIIDLDSQANTTFATGLVNFGDEEKDDLKDNNIYHLLHSSEFYSVTEVARKSRFTSHEIDVIPAHIHLMKQENELNQLDFSKIILVQKLAAVQENYDIVLIDTPPSLNLYARIALIATDYLIIPSDLKPFANEGLVNVKEFIKEVDGFRKFINKPPIKLLGVLPCKISTNARFIQATLPNRLESVIKRYGVDVMDSHIFEREDLAKCTEQMRMDGDVEIADPRSVLDFSPHSKSSDEFRWLAKEILHKIGLS